MVLDYHHYVPRYLPRHRRFYPVHAGQGDLGCPRSQEELFDESRSRYHCCRLFVLSASPFDAKENTYVLIYKV